MCEHAKGDARKLIRTSNKMNIQCWCQDRMSDMHSEAGCLGTGSRTSSDPASQWDCLEPQIPPIFIIIWAMQLRLDSLHTPACPFGSFNFDQVLSPQVLCYGNTLHVDLVTVVADLRHASNSYPS